jgi:hypothetical protein
MPRKRHCAARDHLARRLVDDDGADRWIGRGRAEPAPPDGKRNLHIAAIEGGLDGSHERELMLFD